MIDLPTLISPATDESDLFSSAANTGITEAAIKTYCKFLTKQYWEFVVNTSIFLYFFLIRNR